MGFKDSVAKFLHIEEIKYAIIGLVEAKLELKKLEVQEKLGTHLTNLIFGLITLILGLIVLMFLSILAAVGLNCWLESVWYGYAIVVAVYIILLIIWLTNEVKVKRDITEKVEIRLHEEFSKIKIM